MQVLEMIREEEPSKTFYGLAISITPSSEEEFYSDWSDIGGALLSWIHHRAELAERVHLSVVCDEKNHDDFKAIIDRVYDSDATLSPLLKSLIFIVAFLDSRGQPRLEFEYSDGRPSIIKNELESTDSENSTAENGIFQKIVSLLTRS